MKISPELSADLGKKGRTQKGTAKRDGQKGTYVSFSDSYGILVLFDQFSPSYHRKANSRR